MKREILKYQRNTSYKRSNMEGYPLDWQHQPDVYKKYPVQEHVSLEEVTLVNRDNIFDLLKKGPDHKEIKTISLHTLSKILLLGFNITAVASFQGKNFYYRSMPSAGALYPNEIYLAAYNVSGLKHGIYHFMIKERMLVPLRYGNYKGYIESSGSFGKDEKRETLAASFFISGIFFRTSWKYRKRGYRYVLNDTGHLVESLYHASLFEGIPPLVSYDFDDDRMNKLLGFDSEKEACFALLHLPGQSMPDIPAEDINHVTDLSEELMSASSVSEREVDYCEISDIHRESKGVVKNPEGIRNYDVTSGIHAVEWIDIPCPPVEKSILSYPETIFKRRSKRNFVPDRMSADDFHLLLHLLCDNFHHSLKDTTAGISPAIGFLLDNIEGYENGYYLLDLGGRKAGLVNEGRLTSLSATVCLNQKWLENAALHFLFMGDLDYIEKEFGSRGYRYLMIGAGRLAQIIYSGATALGLGCCGIGALFDYEAQQMLDLLDNIFLLYLVAAGPVKKA